MMEIERLEPCTKCPFKNVATDHAKESGTLVTMLCHESGCLDGEGAEDFVCEGWRRNQREIANE